MRNKLKFERTKKFLHLYYTLHSQDKLEGNEDEDIDLKNDDILYNNIMIVFSLFLIDTVLSII